MQDFAVGLNKKLGSPLEMIKMPQKNPQTKDTYKCHSIKDYLDTYYSKWDIEDDHMMTFLHEVYESISPCDTLLDIGGGPTIHQHISARRKVSSFTFTDYMDMHLEQVNYWLSDHCEAHNWDQYFEYVLNLENSCESLPSAKKSLREKIKNTVRLDILQPPSEICGISKFDIVQCFFCLEAATFTEADFQKALSNVISFAKPDGNVLLAFLRETSQYHVGGAEYRCFPVSEKLISDEIKKLNCRIKLIKDGPAPERDYDSSIYFWVQK